MFTAAVVDNAYGQVPELFSWYSVVSANLATTHSIVKDLTQQGDVGAPDRVFYIFLTQPLSTGGGAFSGITINGLVPQEIVQLPYGGNNHVLAIASVRLPATQTTITVNCTLEVASWMQLNVISVKKTLAPKMAAYAAANGLTVSLNAVPFAAYVLFTATSDSAVYTHTCTTTPEGLGTYSLQSSSWGRLAFMLDVPPTSASQLHLTLVPGEQPITTALTGIIAIR